MSTYNSPGIYYSITAYKAVHAILSFSVSLSLLFFSIYTHIDLWTPINWKIKKKRENEAEKERIAWTAVHEIVKSGAIRLASYVGF